MFKIYKIIILYTHHYKDNNFTKNCIQLYYNLFYSVHHDISLFFFIFFYIILFFSNDYNYLYSFMKYYYKEYIEHIQSVTNNKPSYYKDMINYLITNKINNITIYDNDFIQFYNFIKNIYTTTSEALLTLFIDIPEQNEHILLTNLRILYYIQNMMKNKKCLLYVISPIQQYNKSSDDISKGRNIELPSYSSNEDLIYKSFSKLITKGYEKTNHKNTNKNNNMISNDNNKSNQNNIKE